MTTLEAAPAVTQPPQHGGAGGLIRRLNIVTGLIGGIVLAVIGGVIGHVIFPTGQQTPNFSVYGSDATFLFILVGWVVGFLIGIGAFIGPFRWFTGRDLTHEDAEFMAGKDQGVSRYFRYTTDHKVVGLQYLVMALTLLFIGGTLAMLIRTELGVTWAEVFNPDLYNSFVGTHGIVMVISMIIVVSGPIGNFIVPIMIGARDMAFPRLNALSFWMLFAAVPPLVLSLFVGGIRDGWSVYQPLSLQGPPGMIGYQVTIIVFAFSTAIASVNLMTTILTMRAKGMTWARTPILVYGIFCAALMGLYAFPFYQYSQWLALTDRVLSTSFFDPQNGGSVWLYENLFWLLGHPEVYVILVPTMAACLELMPVLMRKPLFSLNTAIAGFVGVVGLSGLVWAHHMYMTGWAPEAGYPFMLSTELISIPVGLLVLVVIGTYWRGTRWSRLPLLALYGVIFNIMIGGVTGVYLSDVPADQYFHGSMFVTAHFHYMLMGVGLFGAMAATAFWFPKMTSRLFDEKLGSVGFWTAFAGFQLTFISMFIAGLQGQPRRVLQFDSMFNISNWVSTIGAYTIFAGMLIFLAAIVTSWRSGAKAPGNPWASKSLEWQTSTPVPLENFPVLPVVTTRPYDYGVPDPLAYRDPDAKPATEKAEAVR